MLLASFSVNAQNIEEVKKLNKSFGNLIYTNLKEAKHVALQAIIESKRLSNDTLLLESYTNLSEVYLNLKLVDSSLFYCNKGLVYASKLNSQKKECVLYIRKGTISRTKGEFKSSLILYEKALKIALTNNLNYLKVDINNSLALLYRDKADIKKSLATLKKAIDLSLLLNYTTGLSKGYNIKGLLFFNSHKDSTLYYYKKSLKIATQANNKYLQGILLSNIGDHYLNIGDNKQAIVYLQLAEYISNQIGDQVALHYINMSLGIYNEEIGKYDKAINKYKKAFSDYEMLLDSHQKRRVYWLLSGALWHNKQFEEAYEYQEKYIILNDSLFNIKKEKEFETLRAQFEIEKKNNQIILLKKENELAKTRRNWVIITIILIAIPLLGLFLFYKHRAKTQKTIRLQQNKLHLKEKEHIQQKQKIKQTQALIEGQDKERNRIAKELHDGIGGQLASVNLNLSHINVVLNNISIAKINASLKNIFEELRALSHDLSYNYHSNRTFDQLLFELKKNHEKSKSFNLQISVFPEKCIETLDTYIKHNLYRILQELLINIAKHAKAQSVQLSFNRHDNVLILILEDDGKGFDLQKQKKGIGISNIKERVLSINGELTIDSIVNKGTTIIIEIPINKTFFNEN